MIGMSTCEKCRRKIPDGERRIYAGGAVWHPACYPYETKKPKIQSKKKESRR